MYTTGCRAQQRCALRGCSCSEWRVLRLHAFRDLTNLMRCSAHRRALVLHEPGGARWLRVRAGYRAVRDTVPKGIPCRAGYHAVRDTVPMLRCVYWSWLVQNSLVSVFHMYREGTPLWS